MNSPSNERKSKCTISSENSVSKNKMEEINETPEMIERNLQTLREMLKNEERLKSRTDEFFLLCFLRARKFNCDRALLLLKNYYGLRTTYPIVYEKCRPSEFLNAFKIKVQTILPKHDHLGRAIIVYNLGNLDSKFSPIYEQFRVAEFLFAMLLKEVEVQRRGLVGIVNFKNFGIYQFKDIRLFHIKLCASIAQNSFPLRFKAFHLVNEKYYTNILYNLISPFLSEKMKRRVHFHGSHLESLHKYVYPNVLPEEFGGTLPDSEVSFFENEALNHEDDFIEDAKYGFM